MENVLDRNRSVLRTVGLSKKYKNVYAVKGVNMHIEKGDIYGFVGENGAGKTTVIRLITGLAEPTEGTFYLFGEEKNAARNMRRVAGIVENVSLNKSMTALENLKYQCYICGIDRTEGELEDTLREVGLDPVELAGRKVRNFSLGMRQRLGIASVMIQEPEFILLDEPMNGLDPQGFVDVREIILKLNRKGITFLISSHILSELDKICNKIGFISGGVLTEEILVEDLHKKSGSRIVIKFTDPEAAENALARLSAYGFAGGGNCEAEGDTLTVYGSADINEVIAAIVREQLTITSITVKERSVEDYYIEKARD